MNDLKNPELRRELLIYGLGTLCLTVLGALLVGVAGALLALAGGLFGICVHLWAARRRYRDLEALSQAMDRVLHGQDQVLADSREGELAILESEIRKMTLRMRETSEQLLAEKTQLSRALADISHQLRTPLTSMNLTVSLLRRGDLSPERRSALTRDLQRSLERIDWLVETLLKLSRLDAGVVRFEPEPIAAAVLADRALGPLRIPMELREQALILDLEAVTLTVDPAWTTEALGNILKNCMEHTPPGGTISLTARQTPIFTELAVADTGPGIDPADLPRLFERFYRGRHAQEHSVGIGLALARQIVTAQNGTLQAANCPEGGAKFTLRFYGGPV